MKQKEAQGVGVTPCRMSTEKHMTGSVVNISTLKIIKILLEMDGWTRTRIWREDLRNITGSRELVRGTKKFSLGASALQKQTKIVEPNS
mmetsp:Transcript_21108/g.29235  ORF Transcript_21108/g.29235 Transcript_21108/m.29235 type:complete len:89 (-) Transcript_21108:402-668(-)